MDVVVGSGPSGFGVALALLDRGREVTMIDGGATLEANAIANQSAIAAVEPENWNARQIDDWQMPQFSAPAGMALRYGSDHAQIPAKDTFLQGADWFGLRASHAVGGLSNIWGAAVLPNRQSDMAGWPVSAEDLAPHYNAVAYIMPVAGRPDALQQVFPAFPMSGRQSLKPGPQGQSLLKRLDRISGELAGRGIHVGQARQAVADGCKFCGMCLHGCPWNQIFSATHGLEVLKKRTGFTYLPGKIVGHYSQNPDAVQLHMKDGTTMPAERIFLGAGVLETARIVLASQPDRTKTLMLQDSQHFFLPMLHSWRAAGHPEKHPHHTLTEAFIEIDDAAISPFSTHTQIYGWNEYYARDMIARYGKFLPGSSGLFRMLARRLMVAQTFLHSEHSARVELGLAKDEARLTATLHENPATVPVMAAVRAKLAQTVAGVGLYALKFAASAGAPGSSYHCGSTLPMAARPSGFQTDICGRLNGMSRVHVVDASVLPAITATTITFTVMANAHRIGTIA